jgi:hypothetical protein
MTRTRLLTRTAALLALIGLSACGGGSGPHDPTPPTTQPATPSATITAVGAGALTVHPSADRRYAIAIETPIRLSETAGGTADWNFARISTFMAGKEIERFELGSDVIRNSGYSRVAARSNNVVTLYFRQNSDDFDRLDITLGFSDLKDARQFTVPVPFGTFADVNLSFTPASVPPSGTVEGGS